MTVQELIDEITTKTGDSDSTTESKILGAIKSALRRIPRQAKERSVINRTTLSLASGAQTIDISSLTDFFEEYSMWTEVDGKRRFITKVSKDKFNLEYSSNATGRPEMFRIISNANTIEFERKADKAYTITFEYFGNSSNVTTASTLSFRDDIIEIIKDIALTEVFEDREEDDKRSRRDQVAAAGLEKLEADFHRQEDPDFITAEDDFLVDAFE